jgi:hypothetical protein
MPRFPGVAPEELRPPEQFGDLGDGTARADQGPAPAAGIPAGTASAYDHFFFQKQPHTLNKLFQRTGA